MRVGLSLLTYAMVMAFAAPVLLRRRSSFGRWPAIGVLAWQVAGYSVVLAWAAGGLALAVPMVPGVGLGGILAACVATLHELTAPERAAVRITGVLLAAAVVGRAVWVTWRVAAASRHRRRRHAEVLRLIARTATGLPAVVVEHATPMAYCLPGRDRQVVVTSGALRVLPPDQLRAVLAHERAHLAARHHLPLVAAQALTRAFPRVPVFATAVRQTARLLEMCADDAAAARHGRSTVAAALRALSPAPAPTGALAAAAESTDERVRRLLVPDRRPRRSRLGLVAVVAALAAGPILAAAAPVLATAAHHVIHCPVPVA